MTALLELVHCVCFHCAQVVSLCTIIWSPTAETFQNSRRTLHCLLHINSCCEARNGIDQLFMGSSWPLQRWSQLFVLVSMRAGLQYLDSSGIESWPSCLDHNSFEVSVFGSNDVTTAIIWPMFQGKEGLSIMLVHESDGIKSRPRER